ncbi:hypothetical protein EDC01DRAFT_678144 [Geopyxis carbonaria]|nr:hypothetical protein EDC01DRAFT_678144 [Geopyxis carbonaria]
MRCTVHRIFLASLILAAKNLNDSSPKNKHWARYSIVRGFDGFGFSLTEVNLMEKQLLFLLDWDLGITNDDLYYHLEPFLAPIIEAHNSEIERQLEIERVEQLEYEWTKRAYSPYYAVDATPPMHHLPSPPSSSHSGRSSRASDRSEHYYQPQPSHRSHRHKGHRRSITDEYLYQLTPPSSTPSSTQIPALARSGTASSVASSQDNSPVMPSVSRSLLPLDSGKKKLRTPGGSSGGLLSRFLAGAGLPTEKHVEMARSRSGRSVTYHH